MGGRLREIRRDAGPTARRWPPPPAGWTRGLSKLEHGVQAPSSDQDIRDLRRGAAGRC